MHSKEIVVYNHKRCYLSGRAICGVCSINYIPILNVLLVQDIRQWTPQSIMPMIPAAPVTFLPSSICPPQQVPWAHEPVLCFGIRSPHQARANQDKASLGQEGGPLWPIWLRFGRERRVELREWEGYLVPRFIGTTDCSNSIYSLAKRWEAP